MIKLKDIIIEIDRGYYASQAILTNDPVELYFSEHYEGRHVDIIQRLFPEEMNELMKYYEGMGYYENDSLFEAANDLSRKKHLARIVVEGERLYFNTDMHQPLTPKQENFLKNYCRSRGMELFQDFGGRHYKEIELQ